MCEKPTRRPETVNDIPIIVACSNLVVMVCWLPVLAEKQSYLHSVLAGRQMAHLFSRQIASRLPRLHGLKPGLTSTKCKITKMPRRKGQQEPVDIDFTLRRVFGKRSFRPVQREVIEATIAGHDVFLQAATSFGKSLCFQLPAVVGYGITVVVSPLVALMSNQVAALLSTGIPTSTINSNTTWEQRKVIIADLKCGHPHTKLLYVTPELCQTDNFRNILVTIHQQGQLSRVAVDEAHCISEWGHDFRPAYKALAWFKTRLILPSVPIIALTATATERVRKDIVSSLQLNPDTTKFFSTTTARPNLHYEVRYFSEANPQGPDEQFTDLLNWLKAIRDRRAVSQGPTDNLSPVSGIIYVPTRIAADSLASRLTESSIGATAYHAGLPAHDRASIQTRWANTAASSGPSPNNPPFPSPIPDFSLIVATTAFGMGIDAPHVRFVVHYGLPRGFEAFVQEAGRAGRDSKAAVNRVYYSREERDRVLYRISRDIATEANRQPPHPKSTPNSKGHSEARLKSFRKVVEYCESVTRCRHALIGEYFDDAEKPMCDFACDFCREGGSVLRRRMEKGLATEEEVFEFSQREVQRDGGGGAWDD